MTKIGFIYKYNPSEKKGILVHGSVIKKHRPILFTSSDLMSDVETGQLVYFDIVDGNASNIERACLSNFKIDFVNGIVTCKKNEPESSFYYDNINIIFERLDDIITPVFPNKAISNFDEDEFFMELFDDLFESDSTTIVTGTEACIKLDSAEHLPKSITALYNCFGEYKHKYSKNFTIDIFDLSLWKDDNNFYGRTVHEIKFLYDIFVMRKRYDEHGKEMKVNIENDCISPIWPLLLSKFNETDLREIIKIAPKLQPAFPKKFCEGNIELLTDKYGMPDVEICEQYCLNKIAHATTISEYNNIKHKLLVYRNCGSAHLEGEGTPMCKMGNRLIANLERLLEQQYKTFIVPNIISQVSILCPIDINIKRVQNATFEELTQIGFFLENYNFLEDNKSSYIRARKFVESYKKLPPIYKELFKETIQIFMISLAKEEHTTPFRLNYMEKELDGWLSVDGLKHIKECVNYRFSNLDNLDDLNYAYEGGYISIKQYLYQFKQITINYDVRQFMEELSKYKSCKFPLSIQWHVVSRIIRLLNYKNLNSFNCIDLRYGNSINGIRSLLEWLNLQNSYGNLQSVVVQKATDKICSALSNNELWCLFEEKRIKSPGEENIHKYLNVAYKNKEVNKKLINHCCFQDAMLADAESTANMETKKFIIDNLDKEHQHLMMQNASGPIKLYLWQKELSNPYDWELVKKHFHEMSDEIQIRILRYTFGLIADDSIKLSLSDLYSGLVESSTPACSAICGILYILKEKLENKNTCISSSALEAVIGTELDQKKKFLNDCRVFFYPCNGYIAITPMQQDIEYQSFNGILTKEVRDNELYYVLAFYNSPVDLLGNKIEWLDPKDIDIARQVLLRNSSVYAINDKYFINSSEEFFIKQYVMKYHIDDKCGLLSDKERMIELGYLPRNNVNQPLYTNYLRIYEDSDNYVCRCGYSGGYDPNNFGIPFFWCQKKICARRSHFLLPPSKWEEYHFADFYYIISGQNPKSRNDTWFINREISLFINEYVQSYKLCNTEICSKRCTSDSIEKGVWSQELSVYKNICDEPEEEYEADDYDIGSNSDSQKNENQTYERYNGSYAQDEMGYSDDDIDTIFDGDPSAYWNID